VRDLKATGLWSSKWASEAAGRQGVGSSTNVEQEEDLVDLVELRYGSSNEGACVCSLFACEQALHLQSYSQGRTTWLIRSAAEIAWIMQKPTSQSSRAGSRVRALL